jgi:hypothetical protein
LASTYEQFQDPCIKLEYVNTKEQVADVFTKAIPPQGWDHALRLMGVLHSAKPSNENGPSERAPAAAASAAPGVHDVDTKPEQRIHACGCTVVPDQALYRHGRGELRKSNGFPHFPLPFNRLDNSHIDIPLLPFNKVQEPVSKQFTRNCLAQVKRA